MTMYMVTVDDEYCGQGEGGSLKLKRSLESAAETAAAADSAQGALKLWRRASNPRSGDRLYAVESLRGSVVEVHRSYPKLSEKDGWKVSKWERVQKLHIEFKVIVSSVRGDQQEIL